jgi:hypothetical protein
MTDYQRGWLIMLQAAAWLNKGFLPNNPSELATLAGAKSRKKFRDEMAKVMTFFDACENDAALIVEPELRVHWEEVTVKVSQNSDAGKRSAEMKAAQAQSDASSDGAKR